MKVLPEPNTIDAMVKDITRYNEVIKAIEDSILEQKPVSIMDNGRRIEYDRMADKERALSLYQNLKDRKEKQLVRLLNPRKKGLKVLKIKDSSGRQDIKEVYNSLYMNKSR